MITESSEKIIRDFCDLNEKAGGNCSEWCVGATEDAERHLYEELGIPRDYPWCIHRCAVSAKEARAIVEGFHNVGCETRFCVGNTASAIYVFAYRKLNLNAATARKAAESRV
jgi:hypothetical protein